MNQADLAQFERLRSILLSQMERYPLMKLEDLYKLVFQAAMGSEHAVQNLKAVEAYLLRELETMGSGPDEPLIDPISPNGDMVRVHLRPYIRSGADPSKLLEAFIMTSEHHHGSTDDLTRWWGYAVQLMREGTLPFLQNQAQTFLLDMKAQDFPAVHHSQSYLERYKPAYRVVLRSLAENVIR
jgi:hypothetical protein